MLADAGRDDGIAFGEFVEGLNGFLWDNVFAFFVAKRVVLHPRGDLRMPRGVVGRGEGGGELIEAREGELDVAGDGELDAFVFVVLGSVDIDVDDLGLGGEFIGVARDAVIEARGEAEEQVALVDGPIAISGAVHAEPVH